MMTTDALTFDAVAEATPGPKWAARWARSWPAYEAWFRARGGDDGPSREACEASLARHMPELVQVHRRLVAASRRILRPDTKPLPVRREGRHGTDLEDRGSRRASMRSTFAGSNVQPVVAFAPERKG